ncbi:MAG: nickel-dependent hydrogenase large subunit [Anaerolineae bacterium]
MGQKAQKVITDRGERFIIPIGPQHPALKEPGHFEFTVDGETVTDATVRLGYVHRGIEKGVESRNWVQNLYMLERICGICSHVHAMTYCLGVEKLAGVEVPERAQVIRLIVAELERIHSHMLWLGVAAHEAGFDTLFMYSWRDRETVMDLLELLSGNRVNYSANLLGGVKFDISPEQADEIRRGLAFIRERNAHYLDVSMNDMMLLSRTRGVGVMPRELAEKLGAIGPMARASGVARDVRLDAPYGAYRWFKQALILETAGDLEARFVVRLREIADSCRLIEEALDNLPEGELTVRMPRRIKEGETISRVEAPRGEAFYFIKSNGSDQPERIKVRTPTICNMGTVLPLAKGHQLADMPMILVGIDPCFSCNDRMVSLKRDGAQTAWTWSQLREYGIKAYQK